MVLWTIFVVSLTLLGVFVELTRKNLGLRRPSLYSLHARLNEYTIRLWYALRDATSRALAYAKSDIFLKGLHMMTYVALLAVRFLEHQLVRIVHTLRMFRKDHVPRRPTHKLAHLHDVESSELREE